MAFFVFSRDCISCLSGIKQDVKQLLYENSTPVHTDADSSKFSLIAAEYGLVIKNYSTIQYEVNSNLKESGIYLVNSKSSKPIAKNLYEFYKKGYRIELTIRKFTKQIEIPNNLTVASSDLTFSDHSIAWHSYNLNAFYDFNLSTS